VGKLLEIEPDSNEVVFDCAADDASRDAICRARSIVVVAFLDNAKIQFTLTGAELTTHHGRAAFCSDMPAQLLRMQRRSTPRRQPPASTPVSCLVPVPGEQGRYESTRVLDISLGGVALLVPPVLFDLTTDQRLASSYLDLPGIGQIAVTLRVRYMDAWPGEGGGRRCGCEFVELGGPALRAMQRYMNRLEAETQGASRHAA
jgi:c-di-GMP-binding flagellar brake protein YcgR